MKATLGNIKKYYRACNECNVKAGGIFPDDHVCTVTVGECGICGNKGVLIPWVDYDWPKNERDNIFAKMNRD